MPWCCACRRLRDVDALDLDGFCFDCANPEEADAGHEERLRELLTSTVDGLARATRSTSAEICNELVVAHYGKKRRDPGA